MDNMHLALLLLYISPVQPDSLSVPRMAAADVLQRVWEPIEGDTPVRTAPLYRNKHTASPLVETTLGALRGFATRTSRGATEYFAFLGVPFAEPPLGALRFADPVPAQPWSGERDASYERPTCLNMRKASQGSEDCLYINLYTPVLEPSSLKPVMAFIHGGAFLGGSSNTSLYSPDFLLDRDVVVAIFNYRLGPLGFLSLQDAAVPGNAGLKDQRLALRWLRDNVHKFGGDPNRVTIFGESAGAASVNYQLISRSSAGLFQGAIMESGSVLSPWAYTPPDMALRKAYLLAERLGCMSYRPSKEDVLRCLREVPASLMVTTQEEALTFDELLRLRPFAFLPTMEPYVKDAFLTKHPYLHLHDGDFNKVAVMTGSNTAEGLMILPVLKKYDPLGMTETTVGQDLARLVPHPLDPRSPNRTAQKTNEIVREFRHFYFQNQQITILKRRQVLDFLTDVQFLWQIQHTARLLARHSDKPVFNYIFSFDGAYALYKVSTGIADTPGVCHADELGYLFSTGTMEPLYQGHEDRSRPEEVTLDHVTRLWTDFAKTGSPTSGANSSEQWLPYDSPEYHYYDIGHKLVPGRQPAAQHMEFLLRMLCTDQSYTNC